MGYYKKVEGVMGCLAGPMLDFRVSRSIVADKNSKYQEYQYHQLENSSDIRVLELAPGVPSDLLRVRIIHVSHIPSTTENGIIGWPVKYDALSYVWGSGWDDMLYILVDDKYFLRILPNLDVALRCLRSPEIPRTFWVDAICINQQSPEEKNTQIALMLDVYACAENVQIWLGPASTDSTTGMEALKYLAENTLCEQAPWDQMPDLAFFPALSEIFQREWFQRIWVVQEVCVSQKAIMVCGKDSFQWGNDPNQILKFMRRIKYATISPQWERAGLSQLNMDHFLQLLDLQLQHIQCQHRKTLRPVADILDIMYSTRQRKATDPQDKLCAILGLVDQSDEYFFRPGYTLNIEEVFKRLLDVIEI
ncbi:heterokaryon incompatibility protein-domain-containing protein [Bisporella sp. PMI_857]|nr:heterokaryon incompatibility protein-domain-containing protein [Bisporella sp. PMI_857]